MKKSLFILAFIGLVFLGCSKKKSTKFSMVNKWETTYLKIEMPTTMKSDSTAVFEDTFENNPARIARSEYFSDGTFSAWFVDQEGKEFDKTKGTWQFKNDSLYVDFFYGGRSIQVGYEIIPTNSGFKGISKFDWDEDGEYDDLLTMKTKIIK
ncbi:MAG: hypothetical protein CMB99_10240 [Flavobacteriaceae bacterium]|nr:hypothetical protein [Flavobacteriaceae bacterium]